MEIEREVINLFPGDKMFQCGCVTLFPKKEIVKMADNRHPPNMAGSGAGGMHPPTGFNLAPGMGISPMVQSGQPMFSTGLTQPFVPGMHFYPPGMVPRMVGGPMAVGAVASVIPGYHMQGMRSTSDPPYTQQHAASFQNKPRPPASSASVRAGAPKHKSEKERYFEEQQKKLKQFHKPGTAMADPTSSLVDNLFGPSSRPARPDQGQGSTWLGQPGGQGGAARPQPHPQNVDANHTPSACLPAAPVTDDSDDGFGDFLGGPTVIPGPRPAAAPTPPHLPSAAPTALPSVDTASQQPSVCVKGTSSDPKAAPQRQASEEMKDLLSLMMECSDLKAPQKARGFHKPSLIEVQKSGVNFANKAEIHQDSDQARRWDRNTQDLEGLFVMQKLIPRSLPVSHHLPPHSPTSSATFTLSVTQPLHADTRTHASPSSHVPHSPVALPLGSLTPEPNPSHAPASHPLGTHTPVVTSVMAEAGDLAVKGLPEWCHNDGKNLPLVYRHVLEAVLDGDHIVTERLYPILVMSGLPREVLGRLWSLANTKVPGHLTRSELWMLLAFVALVQNKYEVSSSTILRRCPQAPVPFLGHMTPQVAPFPTTSMGPVPAPLIAGGDEVRDPAIVSQSAVVPTLPVHTPAGLPMPPQPASGVAAPSAGLLPSSSTDDDFADFQAAPTPSRRTTQSYAGLKVQPAHAAATARPVAVSKSEDSYGEFIGGQIETSAGVTPAVSSNIATQAAERLEQLYSNGSLTTEECYSSNVRNFFCSSDSSTATESPARKPACHTSPNSLDDDDFTDGHDSMSQVSTSEQSENDDIKAFENYVEEFNRKKETRPRDHPLHSSLPHPGGGNKGPATSSRTGKAPRDKKVSPEAAAIPRLAEPKTLELPAGHVTVPVVGQPPKVMHGDDDDFADFKSAAGPVCSAGGALQLAASSRMAASGDSNLLGEEDKYGALRSVTDILPSLFASQDATVEDSAPSRKAEKEKNEEDEWADFSSSSVVSATAAPSVQAIAELAVSGTRPVSTLSNREGVPASSDNSHLIESNCSRSDNWADFSTAAAVIPIHSKDVRPQGGLSGLHVELQPSPLTHTFPFSDSASADIAKAEIVCVTDHGTALVGQMSAPDQGNDWADFTSAPQGGNDKRADAASSTLATESNSFAARPNDQNLPKTFGGAKVSEVFTGVDQSAVFMVKKQNLGASEIMNVFKVRDDPATLSSYELPKVTHHNASPHIQSAHVHQQQHQQSYGHHLVKHPIFHRGEKELSPDADDDMGMEPPPLDHESDDDEEDHHEYSRGYDLDDVVNQPIPTTVYSPFGFGQQAPGYSRTSAFTAVSTARAGKDRGIGSAVENRSHSLSPASGETNSNSDSLSLRVASLREDSQSVSSLDLPASKVSSRRDSENGGTDSQSVSSVEFGAPEGGVRPEAVMAESKSLDSLDLRSVGDSLEENGDDSPAWGRPPLAGVPVSAVGLSQGVILGDRYNLDGHVEGSERYAYEWERCLVSSCKFITNANTLFNTISSSAVCNEILRSQQGTDYVIGLIEIYRVICRIITALPTAAVNTPSIEQTLKQIDLAWNNLTAFLVGSPLLPDESTLTFHHALLKSDSSAAQLKACGVCLLDVDSPSRGTGSNDIDDTPKLSYGGRHYHAPCANFWVNCVDSMLPALKLPELL